MFQHGIRRNFLVLCLVAVTTVPAMAQRRAALISRALRAAGMEQAWQSHAALDSARSEVESVTIHVSGSAKFKAFEVSYDGRLNRFSEIDLDSRGQTIGADKALHLAEKVQIRLAARNIKAEIRTRDVPAVTLYAQSSSGMIHAIDAENGRTIWAVQVGRSGHPTLVPSASDRHVAVVSGSDLYVLSNDTGEQVLQTQLRDNPTIGPAISDEMVFVPSFNGQIEAFYLPTEQSEDDAESSDDYKPQWFYSSGGRITARPTVTINTISWPNEKGRLFVADRQELNVNFRLETGNSIESHSTPLNPQTLLVASTDGFIYSIHENNGAVNWEFSVGEPVFHAPVSIGDCIYVISQYGTMTCMSADGLEKWTTPHISAFLAATEDQLFCTNQRGSITVVDKESGARLGTIPIRLNLIIENVHTDRLYIADRLGSVQCVRRIGAIWPLIHHPIEKPKPEEPGEQPKDDVNVFEPDEDQPMTDPGGQDVLDEDIDPFEVTDDPFEDDSDPFQPDATDVDADAEPTDESADDADDDPFDF